LTNGFGCSHGDDLNTQCKSGVLNETAVLCPTNKLQYSAQGLIRQRFMADQTAARLFKVIPGT
jgi:hypothetical protein